MAERGVMLTYEAVRQWCLRIWSDVRERAPPSCWGDKWHLDEVFLTINGKRSSLWRDVDQHGNVLDIQVAESTQQTRSEKVLLPGVKHR
jgi:putative transposase